MTKKTESLIEIVFRQVSKDQRRANKQSKRVVKSIEKHKKNMKEQRDSFKLIRNK